MNSFRAREDKVIEEESDDVEDWGEVAEPYRAEKPYRTQITYSGENKLYGKIRYRVRKYELPLIVEYAVPRNDI